MAGGEEGRKTRCRRKCLGPPAMHGARKGGNTERGSRDERADRVGAQLEVRREREVQALGPVGLANVVGDIRLQKVGEATIVRVRVSPARKQLRAGLVAEWRCS